MEFDIENPLITYSDELHHNTTVLSSLFHIESDHMPSMNNYLKTLKAKDFDVSFRREAISSILQVSRNFDPFLSYLSINYLDRFLSSEGFPEPNTWVIRLVAVSCVSLAAKMKQIDFSTTNIEAEGGYIFERQTIQRMEMLILDALKWRTRSVTPFSFVSFFISLFKLKDPASIQSLKARAVDIILKAQCDVKLLEFRPSEIAASALLSASTELFPLQFPRFNNAIFNCSFLHKERMLQCYNAIQDVAMEEGAMVLDMLSPSCETPVNVLEVRFSSSESDSNSNEGTIVTGVGSSTTVAEASSDNNNSKAGVGGEVEREVKRRKISSCCDKQHNIQLSQIQRQCLWKD